MEATITATDPDDTLLLLDWLRQEDGLRGQITRRTTAPEPGHMGGGDIIAATLGSGGVLTTLLASISMWLRSRRSDVKVEVSIGDRKVTIAADRMLASPADVEKMLESASRALTQD